MNLKPLNNYIVALTEEHLLSQAYTGEVSTEQCPVTSIEQDSRRASEGCIFVALRGVHVDGADYIPVRLQRAVVSSSQSTLDLRASPTRWHGSR